MAVAPRAILGLAPKQRITAANSGNLAVLLIAAPQAAQGFCGERDVVG
jgi:hypothetical protein